MSTTSRIIVAEDDRATLALLERYLRGAGYQVIACADGAAALDAIRTEGSGIVLADWMMPELTGPELCREVRRLSDAGELGFYFFVLLTAHSETDQVLAGFAAGADDYLTKPYNKEELLARLRAGERIYRLQSELHRANRELSELKDEFKQMAHTDPLTQIANRRWLFETLQTEWAFAERHDSSVGCIIFDIDHFKSVNDTYGHNAGDAVLRTVAQAAQETVRKEDMLGRLGGEEFLVVVRECDEEGLEQLAERIRRNVEAQPTHCDGNAISVTVSLGMSLRKEQPDPDALLADADVALYRAKESGRNQSWIQISQTEMRPGARVLIGESA